LEKFLGGAKNQIVVGMYDFGAKHILDSVLAHRSKPSFKKLTLVIQKGESVGEGTKIDDLHDDEVIEKLEEGFDQKFNQAWVKIGRVNGWVASSYHIKVAVRDGKVFWLSSGNWQSSNQPMANPLTESPRRKDWLKRYNRDWHAIVEHDGLARTFETFLLHDHENNKGTDGRDEFVLPDILVPDEFFAREAAEDPDAWDYFEPFDKKRKFTVTPLLTPDNYHQHVLKLIQSAEEELLIQNQTFNAPKDNHDELRELVEAVLERQRAGVKVRVIFRLLDRSKARKNLSALKDMGFDMESFRVQKNCHTKGIIVDGKRVLLGSQNWSNDGVSLNRDASLLFDDEELAEYFKKVFEHDWLALADKDIGPADGGLELATSLEDTPAGMVRLTWKDYMEAW
jgi:PLD-like domain